MKHSRITLTLFCLLLIVANNVSALDNDIGFQFSETFEGYFCIDESSHKYCDPKFATDFFAVNLKLTHPSANRYFHEEELIMNMEGSVEWNHQKFEMDPGFFIINDLVEQSNEMIFIYEFTYSNRNGEFYHVSLQKFLKQDEPLEKMWGDLTTMYVKRWQIFKNRTPLPAGVGVIYLSRDLFTIWDWVNNLKSINGNFNDDLEIKLMTLDYFIFNKFNSIYNGNQL